MNFRKNWTSCLHITKRGDTYQVKTSVCSDPTLGGHGLIPMGEVRNSYSSIWCLADWARMNNMPVYHWDNEGLFQPFHYKPSADEPNDPRIKPYSNTVNESKKVSA